MPRDRDMLNDDDRWSESSLPIQMPEEEGSIEKAQKSKPVPAAGYGSCPGCTAGKVALTYFEGHLYWREHTLRTWSGAPMPCRMGATRLCDSPDQEKQIVCFCSKPAWLRGTDHIERR